MGHFQIMSIQGKEIQHLSLNLAFLIIKWCKITIHDEIPIACFSLHVTFRIGKKGKTFTMTFHANIDFLK